MNHNPQKFDFEQLGSPEGFRLLTVEEIAVLSDPLSARSPVGRALADKLSVQFFSESTCRWERVANLQKGEALAESLTYRTEAPELPVQIAEEFYDATFQAACGDFVESFKFLSAFHHQIMIRKGFWKNEEALVELVGKSKPELLPALLGAFDGQKIALQTSEASEALEGLRLGNPADDKIPDFLSSEAEFSDVLLRLMDHAHKRGWRVAEAMVQKIIMNAGREAMHGKNF